MDAAPLPTSVFAVLLIAIHYFAVEKLSFIQFYVYPLFMLSLLVVHRVIENFTHFSVSTPLNSCGTLVNETEDALIFWNEIRADAVIIDNVITRTHDIKFKFYCSYSRRKMLSIQFQPQHIFIGSEGTWIMLSSFFFFLRKENIEIGNFRLNFFPPFGTGVPKCPLSLYGLCFKYS